MLANYHTHTARCHHASGSEREYIEAAIAGGMKILGFSDHAPQFYGEDYVSGMRMLPKEAEEYVGTLKRLSDEYKDDIKILVGFEAEYFPRLFPKLRALCAELGVDYLIMGQHCLVDEREGRWIGGPNGDEKELAFFVDQVVEGISTGAFTYIAHPDIYNFTGDEEVYRRETVRLCEAAKRLSVPLEVNMLGAKSKRHYPSERFFKIASEVGNDLIVGCDAHTPVFLSDTASQNELIAFAKRFGKVLETVEPRKII